MYDRPLLLYDARHTPQAAGATVIAAASTAEKLQACRDSGADLLLNYRQSGSGGGSSSSRGDAGVNAGVSSSKGRGGGGGGWRKALMQLTGGRAVDVVLDNVGGADCEVWHIQTFTVTFTTPQRTHNLPLGPPLPLLPIHPPPAPASVPSRARPVPFRFPFIPLF